MDNIDPILRETLSDMLGAGIDYWADITDYESDDNDLATAVTLEDAEDDGATYRVTLEDYYTAANSWAKKNFDAEYDFYQRFARNWVAQNWQDLDWDVRISDEILQEAIFHEQKYS